MRALIQTLAADETGANDAVVAQSLQQLGMPGGEIDKAAFDESVKLLAELSESTGRFHYAFARGTLYTAHASQPDTPAAQKRADLMFAAEAYGEAARAGDLPDDMRYQTYDQLYSTNINLASLDENQAEYLVRALEAAASSRNEALAQKAADKDEGVIAQLETRDDLSEEQTQRKNAAEDTVNQIIG